MEFSKFSRVDIMLSGEIEIKSFENIVALAIRQLQNSPVQDMIGIPLKSQAGIKAADLINTKQMLERFAARFELDATQLEPSHEQEPDDIPQEVTDLVEMLRAVGAKVSVKKVTAQ